jgi:threonine dehydratase
VREPDFADVRAAAERLRGRIRRTPMLRHRALDAAAGGTVLVKPEPLQVTGSFKLRGATNAALLLDAAARRAAWSRTPPAITARRWRPPRRCSACRR